MFEVYKKRVIVMSFFCLYSAQAGVVQVDTLGTVDNKRMTAIAVNHALQDENDAQLKSIVKFLQECEVAKRPMHVCIERPSSLSDIFTCDDTVLLNLSKYVDPSNSSFSVVTSENLDIRHSANLAHDILTFPVPYQFNLYKELILEGMSKSIGAITFQDVLDEFVFIKKDLCKYYEQANNEDLGGIYKQHIDKADNFYNSMLQILESNKIARDSNVLKYAKKNSLIQKDSLATSILDAFSPLFDLNAIRTIVNSSHKNFIVVGGSWHTQAICSAFKTMQASSLYSEGKALTETPKPVSITQIEQGLSVQNRSFMSLNGSVVVSKIVIAILCYALFYTVASSMA